MKTNGHFLPLIEKLCIIGGLSGKLCLELSVYLPGNRFWY